MKCFTAFGAHLFGTDFVSQYEPTHSALASQKFVSAYSTSIVDGHLLGAVELLHR